jgi:hypothetical protein
MIVLVDFQQQQLLEDLSNLKDRYQRSRRAGRDSAQHAAAAEGVPSRTSGCCWAWLRCC